MRYFIDTEFNEEVDPVDLISLGVVADDGCEFYAINQEYASMDSPKWESCHEWVRMNVRPIMLPDPNWYLPSQEPEMEAMRKMTLIGGRESIRQGIRSFVGDDTPEFWGYFADYDWFLFCRLFGSFEKMPGRWKPICYDVKQFQKHVGLHHLPAKYTPEHNALVDARWTKAAFDSIKAEQNRINKDFGKKGIVWP